MKNSKVEVTVKDYTQKCPLNCYLVDNRNYYKDKTQTTRIKIIAKEGDATCNCTSHVCRKEFDDYSSS